jgi:uracil phosphoribosyltransferase
LAHVSSHPLVGHKLTSLRDQTTPPTLFRTLVRELAALLAYEATADLPCRPVEVLTPMGACASRVLSDMIAIVPILRAGLGMAEGVLGLIPEAKVWHIGLFRDEATLEPREYYNRLHGQSRVDLALVVDPMLATGGSVIHACKLLRAAGATRIKLLSLIAAPEGIARFEGAFPDIPIHVGAVDERLTKIGFIYPGLGDAGDRQFGTM